MLTRILGARAEDVAARYLKRAGYEILAKNKRYTCGEIDLIAKEKQALVFIEVKYRRSNSFGHPYDAVDHRKQKKIISAARVFLQNLSQQPPECRFDVIALCGDLRNPHIDHVKDAFWEDFE